MVQTEERLNVCKNITGRACDTPCQSALYVLDDELGYYTQRLSNEDERDVVE